MTGSISARHLGVALTALACLVLAACTQAATSSYGGSIGAGVTDKRQAAKIAAARERSRRKQAAENAAFEERRAAARQKRLGRAAAGKPAKAKGKVARSTSRRAGTGSAKTRSRVALDPATGATKRVRRGKRSTSSGKAPTVVSAYVGTPRNMALNAPWECVPPRLKSVLAEVTKRWGPVTVNSTHRSQSRNRLVGGKPRSYHLKCQAVDFRVRGSTKGLARWLSRHPNVGGWKRYASGYFHIDTGPKRTW